MIIFLYGPDTYRSRQKLNEIIEHYKKIHKSGLNLKYFNGENLNFEDFRDEILQPSMFSGKKLVIVNNVFSNSEFKEKFLKDSQKFINSQDVILFYEADKISGDDNLFKLLKKSGKIQKFEFLGGQNLKNWIKKEIKSYKVKADPEAIEKLINFVGNDSWQLSNEIQKLVNYRKDKNIQTKDIELLVKPKIETDIFKTIDAIALGQKRKALELLHKHLVKGDSSLYLLSMINYQFRNLLIIKDLIEKNQPYYIILKKTQLNPFVVKKSYQQTNKFTLSELKKIYQKIFQADLNIKTGRIESETALDLLITEI